MACICLALCCLGICFYTDIKYRIIRLDVCVITGFLGIVFNIYMDREPLYILEGIILGGLMYVFSYVLKEKMGYGDCMAVMALGCTVGFLNVVGIMIISFALLWLYCIYLLVIRKKSKKTEIPFIPFMFIGTILYFIKMFLC